MYIKGNVMWLAHGDTAANGVVAFNVQEGYSMPRRDLHVSSALDFRGITGHEDTIWLMDCSEFPCQVKAYPRPPWRAHALRSQSAAAGESFRPRCGPG